jgi:hypothetical protein
MTAKVEIFGELDAVADDAMGALDRPAQASLFDRIGWYRMVAEHCPPPGRMLVLRASQGISRAWLFLAVEHREARAFASWYTLRFGCARTPAAQLEEPIARALRGLGLTSVELYPLAEGDPLPAAFRTAGWIVRHEAASTSWHIDTAGMDFETYWAARPGRLRNTAKRKTKAAGLAIQIHRDFDEAIWADYETVYAASWKGEEGSPAFLRALAEQEGAVGTLRLGIARKDGRPVAAQLWLVENGHATIHKLAYAEDAKELSPGTILSVEMFREALDRDRVGSIDFGTGNDAYKAEWMEKSAPLYRMTAFNPSTLVGLRGAARATASKLVARLRRK